MRSRTTSSTTPSATARSAPVATTDRSRATSGCAIIRSWASKIASIAARSLARSNPPRARFHSAIRASKLSTVCVESAVGSWWFHASTELVSDDSSVLYTTRPL